MEFLRIAVPEARASAENAAKLSSGLSRRERGFIDVISKFVNGQNHAATAAVHEHLKEFPLDSMLLRLAQRLYTQGCVGIGAPDYPPRFYRLMTEAAPRLRRRLGLYGTVRLGQPRGGQDGRRA